MTEHRNPHALVDIDWLQDHLDDPDVRIIEVDQAGVGDATTVVLYGGNNNWFAAYAYWLGTFKIADELRTLYGGENVTGQGETIAYCRIRERSSHTWFVLSELLGHPDVKNYDGSWKEYGSMVGVPVER